MKKAILGVFVATVMFSFAGVAMAAYTLGGGATVGGGNVTLVSDLSDLDASNDFSFIRFDDANNIETFGSLTVLSADYDITDDDCGGGSPRFQVRLDTNGDSVGDGNVFIAIGPSPFFTDCAVGPQSTGNLIGNEDGGRYDFSQFGGSPFTTYSGAPASVLSGTVVGISIVADGGWSAAASNGDSEQTILVDNVNVNGVVYDFTPLPVVPTNKDECKSGGWETFTDVVFKNQGECVSYVQSNDHAGKRD